MHGPVYELVQYQKHFQSVIRRHFWYKRGQIIEQAQRWLNEVNRDMALASGAQAKGNNSSETMEFGNLLTIKGMEKVVDLLIEDLLAMRFPE